MWCGRGTRSLAPASLLITHICHPSSLSSFSRLCTLTLPSLFTALLSQLQLYSSLLVSSVRGELLPCVVSLANHYLSPACLHSLHPTATCSLRSAHCHSPSFIHPPSPAGSSRSAPPSCPLPQPAPPHSSLPITLCSEKSSSFISLPSLCLRFNPCCKLQTLFLADFLKRFKHFVPSVYAKLCSLATSSRQT